MRDLFTLTLMQQRSDVATISLFIFYEFLKLHPSPCLPHVDWKGINSNHLVFPQSNVLPPITSHICFCKTGYHSILPLLPLMTYCVTCRLFGMIESLWFLLIFCFRYFFFQILPSQKQRRKKKAPLSISQETCRFCSCSVFLLSLWTDTGNVLFLKHNQKGKKNNKK